MTDFLATRDAVRAMRLHVWDMDGCYALDRIADAANALHLALQYSKAEPRTIAKLDKHLRRLAQDVFAQFPVEPPSPAMLARDEADMKSKMMREDA